jgi:hypothetical protein
MERLRAIPGGIESRSRGGVAEGSWQARTVRAYRLSREGEARTLGAELAERVGTLTGCRVAPASVVVDGDARVAFLALDGVRFRLQRHDVVLLRACAHCATGEFASGPLASEGDVGHALSVWRPLHHQCDVEDPPEW